MNTLFTFKPIGWIQTCFKQKNGIPRQSNLCPHTKAILKVETEIIQHPQFTLDGLETYSHVWLLWVFHGNQDLGCSPKVQPPRLEGQKVGLFSTRTPHRPNPIGMSVARLQRIDGCEMHLTEIDLLDGTPILDIKPYIPYFDSFPNVTIPDWIHSAPKVTMLEVKFHEDALKQLEEYMPALEFYKDIEEYKEAVTEILTQDPRATHYKKGNYMELYGFCLDYLNILSKFDDDNRSVTVMKFENFKERFVREKREREEKQMEIDNIQYNSKLNDKLGRKIRHKKKKKIEDINTNAPIVNTNAPIIINTNDFLNTNDDDDKMLFDGSNIFNDDSES